MRYSTATTHLIFAAKK